VTQRIYKQDQKQSAFQTTALDFFNVVVEYCAVEFSEYLRSFHIILTYIEKHGRFDYLEFLSAYMDEHEKVFHAYYSKSIGLPTHRDLVTDFGFLSDVQL